MTANAQNQSLNALLPTSGHALALARAGWEVLPLNGKVPLTRHGAKDATRDPEVIRRSWARPHNIGARVPERLVVLDFDPRNGGTVEALEDAAGVALPSTLTVHSGRGDGGQHQYFLHPGGELSASRIPAGIDVKKHSGYCVVPPSIHPATGEPYRWEFRLPVLLPAPVVGLLRPASRPRHANGVVSSVRADALVRAVAAAPEGRRNDLLFWAVCRAHEHRFGDAVFDALRAAGLNVGLGEREVATVFASAARAMGVSGS